MSRGIPLALLALTLGAYAIGTTEFVIVGLIPTIAADLGMPTERRRVKATELPDFAEVAACGTAVVLTPVGRILDGGNIIDYHLDTIGPVLKKLYDEMTGIQHGERPDKHNWLVEI